MTEFEEFAQALFGQLDVELSEEREILSLSTTIYEDAEIDTDFESLESLCPDIHQSMSAQASQFLGLNHKGRVQIVYPELKELKRLKGRKVFCNPDSREFVDNLFGAVATGDMGPVVDCIESNPAKYLVYSTYAIQYISKITTTYGDYLDDTIFVNKFILSRYPSIILYKMGKPYWANRPRVQEGYRGAIKMTLLEESIHSMQESLYMSNRDAVMRVNKVNEGLARLILDMDEGAVRNLSEYLQLQAVPNEFPFARRANLFFFLNPDHFLTEQIGPGVMTYTHVEVDPKIAGYLPELASIYKEWLSPIQQHHAAFSVMEGMAKYAIKEILGNDPEFVSYLGSYGNSDAYHIRKDMGSDFVSYVVEKLGRSAFGTILEMPPTTAELLKPDTYVRRV